MKYQYDPDSWRWLIGEFCDVLKMFAMNNLASPIALAGRVTKNRKNGTMKLKIMKTLRDNYCQTTTQPTKFFRNDDIPIEYADHVRPLSTTTAGSLMDIDHSTVVLMEKREKQQVT